MRYFLYDGLMCRGLPYADSIANKEQFDDGNVYVTKIPKDSMHNAEWLDNYCSKFGEVVSAKIVLNPDHSSRGYGYVNFRKKGAAEAFIKACECNKEICAAKY